VIPPTEQRNPRTTDLDHLDARAIVERMNEEERGVFVAVEAASGAVAQAAERAAAAYVAGGHIIYVGGGTSAHIAAMDAAEIPATFGVERGRFRALVAAASAPPPAEAVGSEDDTAAVPAALDALGVGSNDFVVGVAASGTTPFVVSGIAHARRLGCATCGIANNPGTPLLTESELPILLDTGPEVVTGSTRLKGGTAQKLALNRISTAAMVLVGRVISNLMVEVRPSTEKLRARSVRIVCDLAHVEPDEAIERLSRADWSVRAAIAEPQVSG
jgi:N-acetylmuramic acid 6-phosphate etherase